MERTLEQIRSVILDKGYTFFEKGDFNLNLIPVRENDIFENTFSDTLYIAYKKNGVWQMPKFKWTTLAGTLGIGGSKKPLTAQQTGTGMSGTAVILENQYRAGLVYVSNGPHYPFWKYMKQATEYDYLRDNDKDDYVTRNSPRQKGDFSTHWHPMSSMTQNPKTKLWDVPTQSNIVNYEKAVWSMGCMGSDSFTWYYGILPIIEQSVKLWGYRFTFTLLHGNDFKKA